MLGGVARTATPPLARGGSNPKSKNLPGLRIFTSRISESGSGDSQTRIRREALSYTRGYNPAPLDFIISARGSRPGCGTVAAMPNRRKAKPTSHQPPQISNHKSWPVLSDNARPYFHIRAPAWARLDQAISGLRRWGGGGSILAAVFEADGYSEKGKSRCERPSVSKGNRLRRVIRGWGNLATNFWLREWGAMHRSRSVWGNARERFAGLDGPI